MLYLFTKLNDFILYVIVAVGFSLRFSSSNGHMEIPYKLRNLKIAATRPNVQFGMGGLKSSNLDINQISRLNPMNI